MTHSYVFYILGHAFQMPKMISIMEDISMGKCHGQISSCFVFSVLFIPKPEKGVYRYTWSPKRNVQTVFFSKKPLDLIKNIQIRKHTTCLRWLFTLYHRKSSADHHLGEYFWNFFQASYDANPRQRLHVSSQLYIYIYILMVVSNNFLFSPRTLGKIFTQFDLRIFFKWVGATQPPTIGIPWGIVVFENCRCFFRNGRLRPWTANGKLKLNARAAARWGWLFCSSKTTDQWVGRGGEGG